MLEWCQGILQEATTEAIRS